MLFIKHKWMLLALVCSCALPVKADAIGKSETNKPTPDAVAVPEKSSMDSAAVMLSWKMLATKRKWKTDPALDTKVSFTVQREPLGEFLERLSKLGESRFELPANSPLKAKKLTVTVTDMPIREVIQNLNRLYAINWEERPNGAYSAIELPLSDLEQGIWKFGDLTGWSSPELSMSGPNRKALALALLKHLNTETLNTPAGQPLNAVPLELQKQVRDTIEYQAALSLINAHSRALLPNIADSYFSIRAAPEKQKLANGETEVIAPTAKSVDLADDAGKTLAPLGKFGVVTPVEAPAEIGKMAPF